MVRKERAPIGRPASRALLGLHLIRHLSVSCWQRWRFARRERRSLQEPGTSTRALNNAWKRLLGDDQMTRVK
eukprot:3510890-Amphidinium_carterae.1